MRIFITFIILSLVAGCTPLPLKSGPPQPRVYTHQKFKYRYFPNQEIYWFYETNTYYTYRNQSWIELHSKPVILKKETHFVIIESDRAKPWLEHAFYRKKHPPVRPGYKEPLFPSMKKEPSQEKGGNKVRIRFDEKTDGKSKVKENEKRQEKPSLAPKVLKKKGYRR